MRFDFLQKKQHRLKERGFTYHSGRLLGPLVTQGQIQIRTSKSQWNKFYFPWGVGINTGYNLLNSNINKTLTERYMNWEIIKTLWVQHHECLHQVLKSKQVQRMDPLYRYLLARENADTTPLMTMVPRFFYLALLPSIWIQPFCFLEQT